MTMLERVARALSGGIVPWEQIAPGHKENLLRQARVAIEAMREPTKDMIEWGNACDDIELGRAGAEEHWTTMIDAALGEAGK